MSTEAEATVHHDHANVRWDDDRAQWVYRMSAVGMCPVSLEWERRGVEGERHVSPALQKAFDEGHENEPRCVEMWLAGNRGFEVAGADETVELQVGPVLLRGHTDRTVKHGVHKYVWEGKALGKSYWTQWEKREPGELPRGGLWDKYRKQLACYMAATGLGAVFCVGRKGEDGVVGEVSWEWVQPGGLDDEMRAVRAMVLGIERNVRVGEGAGLGCPGIEFPCGHYWLHDDFGDQVNGDAVEAVRVTVSVDEGKEWVKACQEYSQAALAETTAKKAKADARAKMDAAMAGLGLERQGGQVYEGGGWQMTWVEREVGEKTTKGYVMRYPQIKKIGD